VKCTKCGGPMAVRRGRRGSFLGCTNYPRCRGTAPVPDELKEQLAAEAAAAAPAQSAADLKAIPIEQTCEQCGGPMLVRRSRRGFFLGCAQYPQCKGTREPDETTLAKIKEVAGA
jgi:DNA topoisomerase I